MNEKKRLILIAVDNAGDGSLQLPLIGTSSQGGGQVATSVAKTVAALNPSSR